MPEKRQDQQNHLTKRCEKYINYPHSIAPKPTTHYAKINLVTSRKDNKSQHVLRPEITIVILLCGCLIHRFVLFGWLGRQHMYRVLIHRVDVRLGSRYGHLDGVLAFVCLDNPQVRADLVITLRAPGHIAA